MAESSSERRESDQEPGRKSSSSSEPLETDHVETIDPPVSEDTTPKEPQKAVVRNFSKLLGGADDNSSHGYGLRGLVTGTENPAAAEEEEEEVHVRQRGLREAPDPTDPTRKYLILPATESLGQRDWPTISYGDNAPEPRWRVMPDPTDPFMYGKDLSMDLIQTATGKYAIKGVLPSWDPKFVQGKHKPPMAFDASVGLGGLLWTFEHGSEDRWNTLSKDALYEFAYRCLEDAIGDPIARDQFRDAIQAGQYREAVCNVEDPLPPLPPAPKTTEFGRQSLAHELLKAPKRLGEMNWYFKGYNRPSMAIRPGANRPQNQHILAARMFEHMRASLANPAPREEYSDTSSEGESPTTSSKKSSLSEELDPEELPDAEDPPSDSEGRGSPAPPGDGGNIAQIGEYRCVLFSVILLVLSMFMCLFLYSFKIIR